MQKPSLGWQSWSPPLPAWHGFPRWDYSPLKVRPLKTSFLESPERAIKVHYWCSWYAYDWNITDQKIRETLTIIKKHSLPFTHILIDDGWTMWGDWHLPSHSRFPNLPKTIAHIISHNLETGLWFAPFLADKRSQLFKNHPEWFIKHKNTYVQGLKTMPIWEWFSPQQYLLNFELPEVKKYLIDFLDLAINKWGVTLLKLDFLYAPYFNPLLKSDHLPHHQVAWLLGYIKKHYPKVTTIACGAPFAPTFGQADIVRISKDTALPPHIPNFINRLVYTSRVKMLHQKITVSHLLSKANLDLDVRRFTLDTKHTKSVWEKISSNILGVGDDLTNLSPNKLRDLKTWLTR